MFSTSTLLNPSITNLKKSIIDDQNSMKYTEQTINYKSNITSSEHRGCHLNFSQSNSSDFKTKMSLLVKKMTSFK